MGINHEIGYDIGADSRPDTNNNGSEARADYDG